MARQQERQHGLLKLPPAKAARCPAYDLTARDRGSACHHGRMRILVVDPDSASRSVIANWLEEFFARLGIDSASSGAEALQAMRRRRADLVLVAHPLPELPGVGLTALIKALPNPPAVVVITAGSAMGLDLQCRAAGVDLLLERRHLRSRLPAYLRRQFPRVWADGAAARSQASLS